MKRIVALILTACIMATLVPFTATAVTEYIEGDVDESGKLDAADAIYLLGNVLFGSKPYPINQPYDFDADGYLAATDAYYLLYNIFFGKVKYPLPEGGGLYAPEEEADEAPDVTATMSSASVMREEEVTLTVTLSGASETDAMAIALSELPEGITLKSANWKLAGDMIANFNVENSEGVFAATSEIEVNCEAISFTFNVADDADFGEYEIDFELFVDTTDARLANVSESAGVITVYSQDEEIPNDGGEGETFENPNVTATMSSVTLCEGEEATLTVTLSGAPETNILGIKISNLPERVTFVKAKWEAPDAIVSSFMVDDMIGVCGISSVKDINGEVISLTFNVPRDLAFGEYEIDFEFFVDTTNEKFANVSEVPGRIKIGEHNYDDEWRIDFENHWHECIECGSKKDKGSHKYTGTACNVCGKSIYTYKVIDGGARILDIYDTTLTNVVIPSTIDGYPVTAIGDYVFYRWPNLESVKIPDGVTYIGNSAFEHCEKLVSVDIPSSVTYIGDYAFEHCEKLVNAKIPSSVKYIGDFAFDGCIALSDITLPDGTEVIGLWAFKDCTSIERVSIPSGVKDIAYGTFYGCENLTSVNIPSSVMNIYSYAFSGCEDLKNAYFESADNWFTNIREISDSDLSDPQTAAIYLKDTYVDKDWRKIEDIFEFLYEYEVIGGRAKITGVSEYLNGNVVIPSTLGGYPVTVIGKNAFYERENITSVTIPKTVTSIEGYAFIRCFDLERISIPDSVKDIQLCAFMGCSEISSITIPDTVEFIGADILYETAFYENEDNWENGVLYVGKHLIKAKDTLSGNYVIKDGTKTIATCAFSSCTELTDINIPESVAHIGNAAFAHSGLTSIKLSDSITQIRDFTFSDCYNLSSITLPDTIETIGANVFDFSAYYSNEENWDGDALYIEKYLVATRNDISGTFEIKDGTKIIADGAFGWRYDLDGIEIPNSVTSIGYKSFAGCYELTEVTIPESVETIGEAAFEYCNSLENVYFENTEDWTGENTWLYEIAEISPEDLADPEKAAEYLRGTYCEFVWIKNKQREVTTGDLDGVAGVNASDAIYLLYHVFFGEGRYPLNQACDFDKNGEVEAADAIYLLYHVFFGSERYPLN